MTALALALIVAGAIVAVVSACHRAGENECFREYEKDLFLRHMEKINRQLDRTPRKAAKP